MKPKRRESSKNTVTPKTLDERNKEKNEKAKSRMQKYCQMLHANK